MENYINIMLIDDHSLVRDGIKSLLEDEAQFKVVGEASSGEEGLLKAKQQQSIDVYIVDIRMEGMSGIEFVKQAATTNTDNKFLMLSMHDSEEYVLQSVEAGAHGYLLKDAGKDEFVKAIKTIHEGEVYYSGDISKYLLRKVKSNPAPRLLQPNTDHDITKKEHQILLCIAEGMTNQDIADKLGKSKRTVESQRFSMMKKLNVKNQVELINKAKSLNLI